LQNVEKASLAKIAALQKAAQNPPTPAEQTAITAEQQNLTSLQDRLRELQAQELLYRRNPFKFDQFSTENMMDYDPTTTVDNRRSFWHWQWAVLQADLTAYYGATTPAR